MATEQDGVGPASVGADGEHTRTCPHSHQSSTDYKELVKLPQYQDPQTAQVTTLHPAPGTGRGPREMNSNRNSCTWSAEKCEDVGPSCGKDVQLTAL